MDQQLDQIVIHGVLLPLQTKLLSLLEQRVYNPDKAKKDWFEIYFTKFVLLSYAAV